MLSANQIAWFLNEIFLQSKLSKSGLRTLKLLYLKNEWMELTIFLHAGTNSCKSKADEKFYGLAWSDMGVASHVARL